MLDGLRGNVMITLAILSLLTLTIATALFIARRRQRSARRRDDIPLFTVSAASLVPAARPMVDLGDTPPAFDSATSSGTHTDAFSSEMRFSPGAPTIRTRDGAVSTLARPQRADPPAPPAGQHHENAGEAVDGTSVRYWRAADGTLQFLPGRLLIAAGRDAGHEIRFVRTAGPDGTRVTFGRAEGAPYRHVQLREPTVSRVHARMSLVQPGAVNGSALIGSTAGTGPRWLLENLSSTNPVVVNGAPLEAEGGVRSSVILSDGDRIEMGEVAFVFHAR
jgi:hypothetical protein